MTELLLYAPQKLRPPVIDIVKAIAEDYKEISGVKEWWRGADPTLPVLCFGETSPEIPLKYVKTMTQKQALAKSSTVTEIGAAINLLFRPRKYRDFNYEVWGGSHTGNLEGTLGNIVVVDIETGGDIKVMLPEEMWLLSVALYDGKKIIVLGEDWLAHKHNQAKLYNFLIKPKRKLIAHNMKFDFRSLSAQLGKMVYGHMDTMLLHHAINPGAGEHGLKQLAAKYLGAPDWDADTKTYVKGKYKDIDDKPAVYYPEYVWETYFKKFGSIAVGFEAIPRGQLYEYNALDVYWTWHLYEYLSEFIDDRVRRVALHEFRMGNFFQDIENYGIAVDTEHLDALKESFEAEREGYMDILAEVVSPEFNPNSPKQVKEVLESVDINVKSTDEQTLTDLLKDEQLPTVEKFIKTLLSVRGTTKMLGTYNKGIRTRMHGGRVFPTYKVHGTNTGRMSASDPNIQNIPRDPRLRKLFTVSDPEKYDFLEVDYSQAELRVMAVLSKDRYLTSLFQPGMPDFFDSLLEVAFPRENISEWSADEKKNNRAKLKGVIYGLSYGRTAKPIAHSLEMPVLEAQSIITNYFKAAPEFYLWREDVKLRAMASNGTLETVFGRRFQAEIVTGRSKTAVENSALAFLPQSTASDICVTAAMEVHKWIGSYGARIVGSIHDAILVESPKQHTVEIAQRVQSEMSQAALEILGDSVPFDTDAEWGTSWGTTVHNIKDYTQGEVCHQNSVKKPKTQLSRSLEMV